jgi:hypothetical protein
LPVDCRIPWGNLVRFTKRASRFCVSRRFAEGAMMHHSVKFKTDLAGRRFHARAV